MTKVALVTGGARRIGAEICKHLHEKGYHVIIHFNNSEHDASQLLNKLNLIRTNSASLVQGNLEEKEQIDEIARTIQKRHERLDLLVNNASCFFPTKLENLMDADWNRLFNTNTKAPLLLSIALRDMLSKAQGAIVNILDIHATKPLRDYTLYTASKAALKTITMSLAKELAPTIRVNAVSPGAVIWPEDTAEICDGVKDKIINQTLLKRSGEPQDIAKAVYFLSEMPFVTGQNLTIDGGRTLAHS